MHIMLYCTYVCIALHVPQICLVGCTTLAQEVKVAARPSVRPSVAPSMAPSMAPSAKAAPKLVPPKGPWETVDVESDWETQRWKTQ